MNAARWDPVAPPCANRLSRPPLNASLIVAIAPFGSDHEMVVSPAPDPLGTGFGLALMWAPARLDVVLVLGLGLGAAGGEVEEVGVDLEDADGPPVVGARTVRLPGGGDALPQPARANAASVAANAGPR